MWSVIDIPLTTSDYKQSSVEKTLLSKMVDRMSDISSFRHDGCENFWGGMFILIILNYKFKLFETI